MSLGLEVAFADSHVFFPDGHLSRVGGTFDGTLAAAAIRDADPAAAPPEIRTMSGETLEPARPPASTRGLGGSRTAPASADSG
jgi:hypothetical protein